MFVQSYFDLWPIDPLHRNLKTGLGLGQAQACSSKAVPRIRTAHFDFLLRSYFDRWPIDPLHRDLKTGLGLGQTQAWSSKAEPPVHGVIVAAWSTLGLASFKTFGPARPAHFGCLPQSYFDR